MLGYISRGIAYSAFIATSIVSFVLPSPTLAAVGIEPTLILPGVLATVPYFWGGLMLVASVACLMGVLTRTWVGEYIGIGPLLLCVLALSVAQLFHGVLLNGILLLGLAGILFYRWYMVRLEKSHAVVRNSYRQGWQSWNFNQDE